MSYNKPYWITHHIFEAINDRNDLYRKAKLSGDINDLRRARSARNVTNKLINSAKEDFIKEALDRNKDDPKKFWRIIIVLYLEKQMGQI